MRGAIWLVLLAIGCKQRPDHKETATTAAPLMPSAPAPSLSAAPTKPWAGKRLHLWTTACDPTFKEVTDVAVRAGRATVGIACTSITREGKLVTHDERPIGKGRALVAKKFSKSSLVIANPGPGGFDGPLGMQVISDDKTRAALVSAIVAAKEGFSAIELDLEAMPTAAAPHFNALTKEVIANVPNVEIVVDVHPKTVDDPGWDGPGSHDYRALSDAGAVVRLMTYDLSIGPVPPGPCTTSKWIREVVIYAKGKGVPASKLEIGLPAYGYDFPPKGPALPLRYEEVMALRARVNAKVERDDNGTPHFSYNGHQVWFDDAESIGRILRDLSDVAGDVRGIAIWGIGQADPNLGKVLSEAGF
jgi:spore germination protein YaaH